MSDRKNTMRTVSNYETSIQKAHFSNWLETRISNWLTNLLAWENYNAFCFEKAIIQSIWENDSDDTKLWKQLLVTYCSNILTKDELLYYKKNQTRTVNNFIKSIKTKINEKSIYDDLEENKEFKAYTTTLLLAQKMCWEFGIQNNTHEKIEIVESYLKSSKPVSFTESSWIQCDQTFFDAVQKQKKARNPITFIDLTHKETLREEPIHVKMWLYTLLSRKDKKWDSYFFDMQNNDINTFTLKEEWFRLFERIFNAWCQLHRTLINDPEDEWQIYIINSMNDIQRILTWMYKQPWNAALSVIERHNLEWFIDVTECLFHIWSHRLRGKTGKREDDQFVQLVEKARNFSDTNSWENLFNLEPFWEEVIEDFSKQIDGFWLLIDDGTNTLLNEEEFIKRNDLSTFKRSMPTKDKYWNKYIFSWRCKTLASIVNKMLNSWRYTHIDAFNDILGVRIELIKKTANQDKIEALWWLSKTFLTNKHSQQSLKYCKLKEDFIILKNKAIQEEWDYNKIREAEIVNDKTGNGYSEIKFVFKWYEIQLSETGNNNKGNKDDSNYWFKKMMWLLWRIKEIIPISEINIDSMRRWMRSMINEKRYTNIFNEVKKSSDKKTVIDSNLVYDCCTIQLVHEILLEEMESSWWVVSWTILYQLAKKVLPLTKWISNEYFAVFENQYKWTDWSFSLSIHQLQEDQTPVWKEILFFLNNITNASELYSSLQVIKNDTNTKRAKTLLLLEEWWENHLETKQYIELLTEHWLHTQKETIKKEINWFYKSIGWWNYTEKVKQLVKEIEQWKNSENLAKWIFWDALLDKKNAEVNHSIRARWKKLFQIIGHGVINKLNGILNESGTFITLYPTLNSLLDKYKGIVTFEKQNQYFISYRTWKNDFFNNNDTPYADYYQEIYKSVTHLWTYDQYVEIINTYLCLMIENQIAQTAERAEKSVNWELLVNKINPAKIARIQKTHGNFYWG
jgi:predicted Zn-ribbon and HTH transcriptional regulator